MIYALCVSIGFRLRSNQLKLAPENTVDLWHIDASTAVDCIEICRRVLAETEVQRADRFYFQRHRIRFAATRAAMRTILAGYLETAPETIVFSYGAKGKPDLAPGFRESGLKFNLSHSREHALLAVTQCACVGADIEYIDEQFGTDEIANRFFSPQEANTLRAVPAALRPAAFFSCWTRKEAYIKAVGEGLSLPLDSFDVAFGPGVTPKLLRVQSCSQELSRWSMYDVPAPPGFAAALVVEGQKHRLQHRVWEWKTLIEHG